MEAPVINSECHNSIKIFSVQHRNCLLVCRPWSLGYACLLGAMVLINSALTRPAAASEGNAYGGPIGGTDIRNAYLPTQSGFYGSAVGVWANASRIYGDSGTQIGNTHVNINTGVAAAAISYVYPFKLLGGTLATTVQEGYYYAGAELRSRRETDNGFGDLYAELVGWSKYLGSVDNSKNPPGTPPSLPIGLTIKLSYSMIFPIGRYSSATLIPPGHNDFFFIPNAAASYLTAPNALGDGIEFSGHIFLDIAGKNPKTNYTTGTVFDLDFAASDRLGRFQFGLSGYYAHQLDNDKVNDVTVLPSGKHLDTLYLGPVVAYDISSLKATIKAKFQAPIFQSNLVNATRLTISYAMKF